MDEECCLSTLLSLLLSSSERAAQLARAFRQSPAFQHGIEEKEAVLKNRQLLQDFKTVADVMIQSVVRHDIQSKVRRCQK